MIDKLVTKENCHFEFFKLLSLSTKFKNDFTIIKRQLIEIVDKTLIWFILSF